ncbi:MAG TPA: UDP-N-acetylmuramoyl-L-alanine--D-glutamate ligase, partial [Caulobacteraceae bacterium]|nr:UDP-N-acetylmuramoyl-L-alanine--D-glutamate ligase [Caulobacteraceae bacterium]
MIPVRGFEGKKVAVFGLARTGLAAARALAAGGAEVVVWDEKDAARAAAKAEDFALEDLTTADWSGLAALVLSPGVPLTHPKPHWTVEKARAADVPIMGDIELFARTVAAAPSHKRPKIVAITGTNGKSTTTALIGHVCRQAGRDVRIGGNIGVGVLGLEDMHGGAVYVLELSSYQLDLTSSLKPDVAIILNISPDHLERHGDMAGYVAAKKRILLNQGKGDTAVVGVDDEWCQQIVTEITAANRRTIVPISARRSMGRGVYALQGVLYDAMGERVTEICDLTRAASLPGRHNWQNAAAAYAAARALGLTEQVAAEGLMSFPGLAHRMETVGAIGRVRVVNDSKATNADAARQALSSYPKVYWIAGGQPKAGGIESLKDLFGHVAKAYLIGDAQDDFAATLGRRAPNARCGTMQKAV